MHEKKDFVKSKNLIRNLKIIIGRIIDRTHKLVARMLKFVAALLIMLEILTL